MQVPLAEPAAQVAAGGFMSYALTATGHLYAWGSNAHGEQGVGAWGWSGATPSLVEHLSDGRLRTVRLCCAAGT